MIINWHFHDHLFDSCQLRHRQDAELESDGYGPFEEVSLICPGIPGSAAVGSISRA
jgi:hypothetical protein